MSETDTSLSPRLDVALHERLTAKLRAALDVLRQLPAAAAAASTATLTHADTEACLDTLALEAQHALTVLRSIAAGGPLVAAGQPQAANLDAEIRRLDVENGDILVLRTAKKLTRAKSDGWHDLVQQLVRRQGLRDVDTLVLDNCTDLTVERPRTAMQQQ